jgi:hypothetical protein
MWPVNTRSSWTPDAVLILIGPNDESEELGSSSNSTNSKFIKEYLQLLTMVAANYKHATPPPW